MRVPHKGPLVGGAMDLASCARAVFVIMEHVTRKGTPRLLERCTLPLTAVSCVRRVYTDLAVVDITPAGMVVRDMIDGLDQAELQARTGAPLAFTPDLKPLRPPPLPDTD
jgi:3-oxoadipate CoA-transferase beta subunit